VDVAEAGCGARSVLELVVSERDAELVVECKCTELGGGCAGAVAVSADVVELCGAVVGVYKVEVGGGAGGGCDGGVVKDVELRWLVASGAAATTRPPATAA
jgi:hypothetical protein